MKIFLTTPPEGHSVKVPMPWLGIAYLCSAIHEAGYEYEVLDPAITNIKFDEFRKIVRKSNADLFGMSCNVENRLSALKGVKIMKEEHPNKYVVMGGPFASIKHKQILEKDTKVDIVVRGEGEIPLIQLMNALEKNYSLESLKEIKGISYRKDSSLIINPHGEIFKTPGDFLEPDFSGFNLKAYPNYFESEAFYKLEGIDRKHVKRTMSLMFSRGCPYNCIFCSSKDLWARRFKIIDTDKAVALVKKYYDRGFHGFAFWDDHLILNKKWFLRFMQAIQDEGMDIEYKLLGRVDAVNKEVAEKMGQTGCVSITLGIENGSPHVLQLMNKKITIEQSERAVALLSQYGIVAKAGNLLNTPGETLEDIAISMRFFKKLREQYFLSGGGHPIPLLIYPGTNLERISIQLGLFEADFDWTVDYFEPSNLMLSHTPFTPLSRNLDIETLSKQVLKEAIKLNDAQVLKAIIGTHLMGTNKYYKNSGEKLHVKATYLSGLVESWLESHNKLQDLKFLYENTLGFKLKRQFSNETG